MNLLSKVSASNREVVIYKSKISGWIVVPVFSFLAIVLVLTGYNKIWIEFTFLLVLSAFVTYTLLTTNYTVAGEVLKIRCGFLYNTSIQISTIKKIAETNNPISSPASSLDRLEISYNKYDKVLISPAHKMGFIIHLLKLNPAIEIRLKEQQDSVR